MPRNSTKPAPTDAEKAAKAKLKRDNFNNVVGKRVTNALSKIELIAKGANPYSYTYSDDDITKFVSALKAKIDGVEAVFRDSLKKGATKAKGEPPFTFD